MNAHQVVSWDETLSSSFFQVGARFIWNIISYCDYSCWLELGTWRMGQQNHYYYYYIMNHLLVGGWLDFRLDRCRGHLSMLARDPCFWLMLFSNWLLFTILHSWLFGNGSKNQQICTASAQSIDRFVVWSRPFCTWQGQLTTYQSMVDICIG